MEGCVWLLSRGRALASSKIRKGGAGELRLAECDDSGPVMLYSCGLRRKMAWPDRLGVPTNHPTLDRRFLSRAQIFRPMGCRGSDGS